MIFKIFRPENLLATSQRMMESTSIMEMKNKDEDEEVSDTEPQTTHVGFQQLVNSADDINAEESKTEKNSEGIGRNFIYLNIYIINRRIAYGGYSCYWSKKSKR